MYSNLEVKGVDGFTLLELLVASSLSFTITMLLLIVFSTTCQMYQRFQFTSEKLENGRFAIYFLNYYLKNLSHKMCDNSRLNLPLIHGFESSDVRFRTLNIKKNSDVFELLACKENRLIKLSFFVAKNASLKNEYSLYMKQEGKPKIEIANGIEHMTLQYGMKCPDSKNVCHYLRANQVKDWKHVVSLKIILLTACAFNYKAEVKERNFFQEWRTYVGFKNE